MKFVFLFILTSFQFFGQKPAIDSFKKYPFPTELCASAIGGKIAWAMDEQGKRNIYTAQAPDYKANKITNFDKDDGQEITSLQISNDGKQIVFVRGGDHGSNWDDELPLNPTGEAVPQTVKVASVPFAGGAVKFLSEGDYPLVSPDNQTIAFIKNGQVYISPIDSTNKAKVLFTIKGTASSLAWDPTGNALAFVSQRGDHSIIGVFSKNTNTVKWISPSFTFDSSPKWSVDGKKLVFVREPGKGGVPDPILKRIHDPWAIYIADIEANIATKLWEAPKTLEGSIPDTHGGTNLHWSAGDNIVFLSYHDGWPHLYSIPAKGGKETLLTPGNFMCEHIKLSADKTLLTFSANTGPDPLDLERRHACKVSVDKPNMQVLTPGDGLEWTPISIDNNQTFAFIGATSQQPPMPAILKNGSSEKSYLTKNLVPNDFPQQNLITPKQVIFTAKDGKKIHADLFMPSNGNAKKAAIVYVHGGPPRQMLLGWHYSDYYSNAYASNQYLASLGYVVLAVNYRLGIGYGYEFHKPEAGGIRGAAEYQDIKAAGEWLQKQSYVNPQKIGIYGGSYGGYLTAMALAKDSQIFKAGVDIHGVHDWGQNLSLMTAYQNKTETPIDYEMAKNIAWRSSPVAYMNTWKSPVLIIHGDDDRNVRFNQSTDLVNRLEKLKIPYETMVIVDDTHHWMKWENAVKVYQATADFFERKLR